MTDQDDETPTNMPPRDIERDVLAERRARRGELQGESMLARRAELAEETARTLEGRLSGIQERLREAERECASATERLGARERELRSVSERLVAGERELRSVSSRLTAREQELRSVSERLATREQDLRVLSQRLVDRERELRETELEIHERIHGLESRLAEFQSELASERAARIEAERELSRLRAERDRVEAILNELKSVAKRLREVGAAQEAAGAASSTPASTAASGETASSPAAASPAAASPAAASSTAAPSPASTQKIEPAAPAAERAPAPERAGETTLTPADLTGARSAAQESGPSTAPGVGRPSGAAAADEIADAASRPSTNGAAKPPDASASAGETAAATGAPAAEIAAPAAQAGAGEPDAGAAEIQLGAAEREGGTVQTSGGAAETEDGAAAAQLTATAPAATATVAPVARDQARETGGKGIQMAEALASAVERLRARVAAVGELNERREAALAAPGADRGAPYAPPLALPESERRAWLAPAIRQMSEHGGGRLAGELIVELLPAQAKLVKGTLRYMLRIEELGGYEVELADGRASIRSVGEDGGQGPSFDTEFTLEGPAAAFAEFAAGGVQRRPRGLRVPGRRRRARRLFAERRSPVALADLAAADTGVWPGLLLAALAEAVDPAWTITDTFTVAFSIEGRQSAMLDVGVRAGMPLRVSRVHDERAADQPAPVVTVRLGETGFLHMLAGTALPEGEQILVQGDVAALERLLTWTDRVQGIRRFGA